MPVVGGDGWGLALSSTSVYNVFHHSGVLTVACHLQSDASPCWSPETITDSSGNNFATPGQPGLWLDQNTGKLYVFATRASDGTGGVVCIDTTQAPTNTNPFCGFTPLTLVGDAPISASGISAISDPALVGTRWMAFNYVDGSGTTGTRNELLCFDVSTLSACPSQPYIVNIGSSSVSNGDYPEPAVAGITDKVVVPVTVNGTDELGCFDGTTLANCSGSWPMPLGFSYDSSYGAPFPLMSASGTITGFCLPTGSDPCYDLSGNSVNTPAGMTSAIPATSGWNGPGLVLGPRVYIPNGNSDQVDCYDYGTSAACANFPRSFSNLGLLYTVNPDPQRPTCIWVNSDDGSGQIQNFDAYTGGACGQGPIRVLASSFVVSSQLCQPASYTSLQVLSPARNTYTSGTVSFEDGDGNPIPGIADETIDNTGAVSLSGLNLTTSTGLPEFLITLVGASGTPTSVTVQLTWTGTYDPSCIKPGTTTTSPAINTQIWAGYVSDEPTLGPVFTRVDLPSITCNTVGEVSMWVGIDGYQNDTVEQDGVTGACTQVGGQPQFHLWYELFRRTVDRIGPVVLGYRYEVPVMKNLKLVAGDSVDLSVAIIKSDKFLGVKLGRDKVLFTIDAYDANGHHLIPSAWSHPETEPLNYDATYGMSECILETPGAGSSGTPTNLPNFGTATFTNCTPIDQNQNPADLLRLDMQRNGHTLATTGDVARNENGENSFVVTWGASN